MASLTASEINPSGVNFVNTNMKTSSSTMTVDCKAVIKKSREHCVHCEIKAILNEINGNNN